MSHVIFEGFVLQASLIFALGAQNIFVLESGLKGQYPLAVSVTCFLCDFALIMLGVAGAATLFTQFPQIKIFIGILGILFLFHFGWTKLWSTEVIDAKSEGQCHTLKETILKSITYSVINPHAYLDGIILIGGYSAKYDQLSDRFAVGMGAASFSLIWFLLLTTAASTMVPLLKNPRHMRFVMGSAGVALIVLSGKLGVDVYGWIQKGVSPVTESISLYNASGICISLEKK
jgi:L-lysine exporter family protein LysE/ArgO